MSVSKTPRTDAQPNPMVSKDFARKLETELAEAQEKIDQLEEWLDQSNAAFCGMDNALTEAKEELDKIKKNKP